MTAVNTLSMEWVIIKGSLDKINASFIGWGVYLMIDNNVP